MAWHAEVTQAPTIEDRRVSGSMRLWDDAATTDLVVPLDLHTSDGPGIQFPGFVLGAEALEAADLEWHRFLHADCGRELGSLHRLQLSLAPECPAAHIWRVSP